MALLKNYPTTAPLFGPEFAYSSRMIDGSCPNKNLYAFDLFDTLVCRPLKRPVYLFDLIEHTGHVSYRFPLLRLARFRLWRMLAERIVRLLSSHEDIHLKDIYRLLGWIIQKPPRTLRQELHLEDNLIRPIPEHIKILSDLLSKGNRCCIVSDVYLPQWFLRKVVRQHIGLQVDVFSSSHHGVTKASGNLFRVVAANYQVEYKDIVHIGDNSHSDFHIPRSLGMDAHKVADRTVRDSSRTLFEYFSPRASIQNVFSRLGYSLVGPMCISFAMFIDRDVRRRGIDKIFFGARDGYLIKEAFDLISNGAQSRYLKISRLALYVPAFAFHGGHDKFFADRVSANEFFERLGMPTPEHLRQLDPIQHRHRFENELEQKRFQQRSLAEAELLADYLRQNDFIEKVAFVDLGWRGTLQDSLQAILRDDCEIHGYYFGTILDSKDKNAYYFNNCLPPKRFSRVFQSVPVFEFLFTEPVTSLKKINKSGGEFTFEYLNDESSAQIRAREEIAKGCRSFFSDFDVIVNDIRLSDDATRSAIDRLIHKFLYKPDTELMRAFEGITHSEGFGGSNVAEIVSKAKFTLAGYRNAYWRGAYVAAQKGLQGVIARSIHAIAQSSTCLFVIHRSHRVRQLIDRFTA